MGIEEFIGGAAILLGLCVAAKVGLSLPGSESARARAAMRRDRHEQQALHAKIGRTQSEVEPLV